MTTSVKVYLCLLYAVCGLATKIERLVQVVPEDKTGPPVNGCRWFKRRDEPSEAMRRLGHHPLEKIGKRFHPSQSHVVATWKKSVKRTGFRT